MPVEQIHTVAEQRPDIRGTAQLTASGDIDLTPSAKTPYRIEDLHADLTVKGVQFAGQPVGDAHLVANSQGDRLRAHLDSTIAGSNVTGDGEWRIEGDYPGTATVQFTKVDLARLRPRQKLLGQVLSLPGVVPEPAPEAALAAVPDPGPVLDEGTANGREPDAEPAPASDANEG